MAQHTIYSTPLSHQSFKAIISAALLSQIANGATLEEAFTTVFGPGVYNDLVSGLYDDLRKGQG